MFMSRAMAIITLKSVYCICELYDSKFATKLVSAFILKNNKVIKILASIF